MGNAESGIDSYLASNLHAPAREMYNDFNNTYTGMQERAQRVVREKAEMAKARKAKTKENKAVKAQKIVDDLTALLDEPFRECAMKHAKNQAIESSSAKLTKTPCICLECPFIDDMLKQYILSPSKATKKAFTGGYNQ